MKLISLFFVINLINAEELCGISFYSNITKQEHFPWIAALYSTINKTQDGSDKFLCGSSIISEKYSLTAGHCIQEKGSSYKRKFDEIYLLANLSDLKNLQNGLKIFIEQIFVHPDYNAEVEIYDADIALMKFKDLLIFNGNVMPICLWNSLVSRESKGKIVSFTDPVRGEPGYDNYEHDPNHNHPKIFNMPIRRGCTETQPRFREIASNRTFCAGGLNYGQCLEVGNSGSSMAVKINEKYFVRGIVSSSFIDFAGCDNYTFSLFTDVPKFKPWIDQIILK